MASTATERPIDPSNDGEPALPPRSIAGGPITIPIAIHPVNCYRNASKDGMQRELDAYRESSVIVKASERCDESGGFSYYVEAAETLRSLAPTRREEPPHIHPVLDPNQLRVPFGTAELNVVLTGGEVPVVSGADGCHYSALQSLARWYLFDRIDIGELLVQMPFDALFVYPDEAFDEALHVGGFLAIYRDAFHRWISDFGSDVPIPDLAIGNGRAVFRFSQRPMPPPAASLISEASEPSTPIG